MTDNNGTESISSLHHILFSQAYPDTRPQISACRRSNKSAFAPGSSGQTEYIWVTSCHRRRVTTILCRHGQERCKWKADDIVRPMEPNSPSLKFPPPVRQATATQSRLCCFDWHHSSVSCRIPYIPTPSIAQGLLSLSRPRAIHP